MLEADLWLHFGTHAFGFEVFLIEIGEDQIVFQLDLQEQSGDTPAESKAFMDAVYHRSNLLIRSEMRLFLKPPDKSRLGITADRVTLESPMSPWPVDSNDPISSDTERTGTAYRSGLAPGNWYTLSHIKGASPSDEHIWSTLRSRL